MIYVDTSVVLAYLLAEDHTPTDAFWQQQRVANRLVEDEAWTRIDRRRSGATHGAALRDVLARSGMLELSPLVLARATEPFPMAVRALDALHLATCAFLLQRAGRVCLATYDARLSDAASAIDLSVIAP